MKFREVRLRKLSPEKVSSAVSSALVPCLANALVAQLL